MAAAKKPAKRMSAKQMKKTKGGMVVNKTAEVMNSRESLMNESLTNDRLMERSPVMSKLPKLPTR